MRRAGASLALGLVALAVVATPASARGLTTGFADVLFRSADPGERSLWLDRAVGANAGLIRINVLWSAVAPSEPADPADPGDPAYDFEAVDAAVVDATDRGLRVLLTAYKAPGWAEGEGGAGAPKGSWKPDPAAFGDFGRALAERYRGDYDPGDGVLPRVSDFQAWNEPTLTNYLSPQIKSGRAVSPGIYRQLLNSFGAGVHALQPDATVVTAGTAPYGGVDPSGRRRLRPLEFWRAVFCLSDRLKPRPCPVKARFDVLDHHPINTSGGPTRSALDPDDVSTPDMDALARVLRAAERARTIRPKGRHPLWATEIWWASNPPETFVGVKLAKHARWLEQALYELWKDGVRVVVNLQIADSESHPGSRLYATGIYFQDGTPKPALRAWRFPFVTERRRGRVHAWGRAPRDGKLRIERRDGSRWRTVSRFEVESGQVFERKLAPGVGGRLRARIGDDASLVWTQK